MTINKLSSYAVKINLDSKDFQKYKINYSDINIENIKVFLVSISDKISEILGIDIDYAKLFVEVFSRQTKCIIFVSVDPDEIPQKTSENKCIICQFSNFDLLEKFCYALNALYKDSVAKSSLFFGYDTLRLVLVLSSEYNQISYFASGYCNVLSGDEINTAVTQEYYKKILQNNAVEEILLSVCK